MQENSHRRFYYEEPKRQSSRTVLQMDQRTIAAESGEQKAKDLSNGVGRILEDRITVKITALL